MTDLEKLLAKKTVPTLIVFILKHPIIGISRVLPHTRFGHPDGEVEHSAMSVTEHEAFSSGDNGPGDGDDDDPMDTLNEAESTILDQQVISAVERASDARLFGGRDHEEDRFVRLKLRNSYHDIAIPGGDVEQHIVFEPRLLLHESGVVQLDLRLSAEGPLSTDQVLAMMWGPEPRITRSEMSTPLLAGSGWEPIVHGFSDELDAGKPLGRIEHDYPASMSDALAAHLHAAMRTMRCQYRSWINYPVAIVEPGDCCSRSRWRLEHGEDVHRLAIRARGIHRIAQHVDEPKDLSMKADHSLFATMGSAVYIQWEGPAPLGIDELDTVLVLEYALLIYMRLQSMESDVARMTLGERKLRKRYRDAIVLFSELRQGNLRAGESRDVVRHVLTALGADQMRSTIQSALSLAGMAHSTVSAAKASRRSWWITLLATLIAVLVSMPSLRPLLKAAAAEPVGSGVDWILIPLRWAAPLGFWGPWALLGSALCSLFVLWSLGWLFRHRPQRLPSFRRGYAWPTHFTFAMHESTFDAPESGAAGSKPEST